MYVGRIIYPVTTLGPGNRLVIWTTGCSKKCKGCMATELQTQHPTDYIDNEKLIRIIADILSTHDVDGITISGGDPLEQADDICAVLPTIKMLCDDILMYTGYEYNEVKCLLNDVQLNIINDNVSVLVDGRYVDELNNSISALRGSTNQNIIFLQDKHRKRYEDYISDGRKIEYRLSGNSALLIGILNRKDIIQ